MTLSEKPRKRISVVINDAEYQQKFRKKSVFDEKTWQTEADLGTTSENTSTGPRFGCRHVQAILLCLAFICGLGTRNNISVAIVAMTDNTTSPNPNIPYYDWDNTSVILSAFFWSYILLQIPAGYLGKRFGPKYFLLVAFFVNCCASALTPFAAEKGGSTAVIVCRVVQGFCQGFLYPSIQVMMGTWVPSEERSTINNFVYTGVTFGSMYASLVTGYVSSSRLGWPYSFYILALTGFLWCILWFFFGYDTPAMHPRITLEEKTYIQRSLKQQDDVDIPIPWKNIVTCVPFQALVIAMVASTYGLTVLTTEIPTYLAKVMNFDVKSNALIVTLPSVIGLMCAFITGPLSDWLIGNQYLTRLRARKIFHLIGSYGHGLCLIWLALLTKSQANMSFSVVVILGLTSMFSSCLLSGANINHLDLSPRFSGILYGILNACSQGSAVIAPLVAQWVIKDKTDPTQWRVLFLSAVAFFFLGGTVFALFSTATRQPWDGPENKELEERRKKISVISLSIT